MTFDMGMSCVLPSILVRLFLTRDVEYCCVRILSSSIITPHYFPPCWFVRSISHQLLVIVILPCLIMDDEPSRGAIECLRKGAVHPPMDVTAVDKHGRLYEPIHITRHRYCKMTVSGCYLDNHNFTPCLRVHEVLDDSGPERMTLMVSDNVDYMCMKICFDQRHKDDFWSEHGADAPRERQIRKGSLFTLTQYTTHMENVPPNPWKVPVIRVERIKLFPPDQIVVIDHVNTHSVHHIYLSSSEPCTKTKFSDRDEQELRQWVASATVHSQKCPVQRH